MTKTSAHAYAAANRTRFVGELREFVAIPSVSAEPKHAPDVRRCAEWLAGHLRGIGMPRVRIIPTPRHPIVYAECLRRPGRPTLLIYGHYDVQPVDPVSEWRTPPFGATVVGDRLFGRGASDDKGQLFAHLKALEAWLQTSGPPVNVKCLFEGEEEIGSTHLDPFVRRNRRPLWADAVVVSDMKVLGPDKPSIAFSVRGALALELTVTGQKTDLHSGNFGGAVLNPLQAMCEIIAGLHDETGRVAIAGFYDSVRPVSDRERERMRRSGPDDRTILADAGARGAWGEPGYTLYERTTIRPALTINGLTGGYQKPGAKAIIPARASAKLGFRLVPGQHPDEVERLLREHLARVTPPAVRVEVKRAMAALPSVVDRRHPAMRAAAAAYQRGFGARPVFHRLGGSIPIVDTFNRALGIVPILMGFALPDAAIHAPNENLHLPTFHRAVTTCIAFLLELSRHPLDSPGRDRPRPSGRRLARGRT